MVNTENDLRAAQDFIDSLPDGVKPTWFPSIYINVTKYKDYDSDTQTTPIDVEATRLELAKVIAVIGPCKKAYTDDQFTVSKEVGGVHFQWSANRQVVCNRRVTGVRVVPERTVEDVEWDCETISFKGIAADN
jgi:hypothetical protein